ncbi:MAG TPA: phasin family protein [Nevskiaceae bacterium]|nr:phasin family protein [Nevskiaceae bacterium]
MANKTFKETVFDPFFGFGNKLLDHGFELADIGVDTVKQLGDQQTELVSALTDFSLRQFDAPSSLKDCQSYLTKQAEAGKTLRDQSVQYVAKVGEIYKAAGTRYVQAVRKVAQSTVETAA